MLNRNPSACDHNRIEARRFRALTIDQTGPPLARDINAPGIPTILRHTIPKPTTNALCNNGYTLSLSMLSLRLMRVYIVSPERAFRRLHPADN